jgi:hypothetical protein
MSAHENLEHAEHAEHAAHSNKKIALLISVLALFLALSETLGKSAQTELISTNVTVNDTWAFYQARVIRITILNTAAQALEVETAGITDPVAKAARDKVLDSWKKTAARYDSDPEGKEGRKELFEKARDLEGDRDTLESKYHNFEISAAAFQIGIVLASAAVITSMAILAWLSGALGLLGLAFAAIGIWAPDVPHDLMHWVAHFFAASPAAPAKH